MNLSSGPFHGAMAVTSVTRCRCRRRRRCCCCCGHRFYIAIHQASLLSHAACAARRLRYGYAGGVRRDTSDTWWMVIRRAAARCGEWAQHFSNASCFQIGGILWARFYVASACLVATRGSAMAEGLRDALVSRNSAATKHSIWKIESRAYCVALFAWSYVFFIQYQSVTDRHTHTDTTHTQTNRRTDRHTTTACTALSIASRVKNRPYCTAHQV